AACADLLGHRADATLPSLTDTVCRRLRHGRRLRHRRLGAGRAAADRRPLLHGASAVARAGATHVVARLPAARDALEEQAVRNLQDRAGAVLAGFLGPGLLERGVDQIDIEHAPLEPRLVAAFEQLDLVMQPE